MHAEVSNKTCESQIRDKGMDTHALPLPPGSVVTINVLGMRIVHASWPESCSRDVTSNRKPQGAPDNEGELCQCILLAWSS